MVSLGKSLDAACGFCQSRSQLLICDGLGVTGAEGEGEVVMSRQHTGAPEPGVSPTLMHKQPFLLGELPACHTSVFISCLGSPLTPTISHLGFRSTAILFLGFYLPEYFISFTSIAQSCLHCFKSERPGSRNVSEAVMIVLFYSQLLLISL